MPSVAIFNFTAWGGTPNWTILKNFRNLESSDATGPFVSDTEDLVSCSNSEALFEVVSTKLSSLTISGRSKAGSFLSADEVLVLSSAVKPGIDDNYNNYTVIQVNMTVKIQICVIELLLLTCDSSISNDASTFWILYSNSIKRDSQDLENSFKNDTVFMTKWLIKAIVRFWWIGNIYTKKQEYL